MSGKTLNKERRVYIDTNVLINYYRGLQEDTKAMEMLFKMRDCELYASVLTIAQTISTLQGNKQIKASRESVVTFVRKLANKIHFIGFTDKDIEAAFVLENSDLEDNLQYVIGSKLKCYYYVTNNVKDYKYNAISAITPSHVYTIDA